MIIKELELSQIAVEMIERAANEYRSMLIDSFLIYRGMIQKYLNMTPAQQYKERAKARGNCRVVDRKARVKNVR